MFVPQINFISFHLENKVRRCIYRNVPADIRLSTRCNALNIIVSSCALNSIYCSNRFSWPRQYHTLIHSRWLSFTWYHSCNFRKMYWEITNFLWYCCHYVFEGLLAHLLYFCHLYYAINLFQGKKTSVQLAERYKEWPDFEI